MEDIKGAVCFDDNNNIKKHQVLFFTSTPWVCNCNSSCGMVVWRRRGAGGWGGGKGERTHLLPALEIRPSTTDSVRSGAPFLVLIDTSNIWVLEAFYDDRGPPYLF